MLCPLFRLILSTAKSTGLWCTCLYAQAYSTVFVLCPLFRLILSTAKSTGLWCTCLYAQAKKHCPCVVSTVQVDFEHRQEHWPVVYMPDRTGFSGGWRAFAISNVSNCEVHSVNCGRYMHLKTYHMLGLARTVYIRRICLVYSKEFLEKCRIYIKYGSSKP